MRRILAADVGGTKTNLAIFEAAETVTGAAPARCFGRSYTSAGHESLEALVARFLREAEVEGHGSEVEAIAAACLGIAGPVVGQRCEAPNLPWTIEAERLARRIALPRVRLINDIEATAHGIPLLRPDQLLSLNEGRPRPGANAALIAAGTGLGELLLLATGAGYRPIPGEGGHCDFAPRDELEIDLLRFLLRRWSHVSYERVVSGPGLFAIYEFLRQRGGHGQQPDWLAQQIGQEDPSAVVSRAALEGRSALARAALDLFVSLYGAEAGNLALKLMALGGVYVGGGIAPKIRAALVTGHFIHSFVDKGRFAGLMAGIPVWLILEPETALLGAARRAMLEVDRGGKEGKWR